MTKGIVLEPTVVVDGKTWNLYSVDWTGPDGTFATYIYAISFEHAAAMLEDLKDSAVVTGQVLEAV